LYRGVNLGGGSSRQTINQEYSREEAMLKHAVAAVCALTALAAATTSQAAGLPTGKRQHMPFTILKPTDQGTARPGQGVLRSMDGGGVWHHYNGLVTRFSAGSRYGLQGQYRTLRHRPIDAAGPTLGCNPNMACTGRFTAKPQRKAISLIVPAVKAIREPVRHHQAGRVTGIAVDPSDPNAPRGLGFRAETRHHRMLLPAVQAVRERAQRGREVVVPAGSVRFIRPTSGLSGPRLFLGGGRRF
jgi:hypothetical protein